MNSAQKKWCLFLLVIGFFLIPAFSLQASNFSQTLNFQGKLKDAGSTANGNYNIKFELCSASDCSTVIWTEYHDTANAGQATVTNGIFNVTLGSDVTLVGIDLNQTLYLRITVDGTGGSPSYSTPVGIIALGMVPAAREADYFDGLDSSRYAGVNASGTELSMNGVRALTSAGSVTSVGTLSGTGGALNNFFGYGSGISNTGWQNVFMGSNSGSANTTGWDNVLIGYAAGSSGNGNRNVAVGSRAGSKTTSDGNIFVGYRTGDANTSGAGLSFLGYEAGYSNTTGTSTTALGYQAGYSNSTGSSNLFLGYQSGYANTVGSNNTYVGTNAGNGATSTSNNTFLGYNAGASNTASSIVAIGYQAGKGNTKGSFTAIGKNAGGANGTGNAGSYNTFIGDDAGGFNTTGWGNTFVGEDSGRVNTTGVNNTFVGALCTGAGNISGGQNIFIGPCTGYGNNSGSRNFYVGYNVSYYRDGDDNIMLGHGSGAGVLGVSGDRNLFLGTLSGASTDADDNIFLGYYSGYDNTSGTLNLFIGNQSGVNNITGNSNLFLGYQSGFTNTAGSNNLFLGYQAGYSETGSNKLYLDNSSSTTPLIYGEFDNDLVTINGTLNLGGSNNELRFYEGSNYVGFEAPALSGNQIWVLPDTDATTSGQLLASDATGNLFWSEALDLSGYATVNASGTELSMNGTSIIRTNSGSNLAVGVAAGAGLTSASSANSFFGWAAGANNLASQNVFLGRMAGAVNVTGADNVLIGERVNSIGTEGDRNIMIGSSAGRNNIADANIFIGYHSGYNNTTGASTTALGYQAGYSNSTGSSNLFLGYQAGYSETGSNKLYLDNSSSTTPLLYGEFDNDIVRINGQTQTTGGITIGATSTNNLIDDASNGAGSATLYVGNETIDTTVSDQRLKTNIATPTDSALAFLGQFDIKSFEWLPDNPRHDYGPIPFGLIAQEVKTIAPQYIRETDNPEDYISVRFADLVPALIGAIQELSSRVGESADQVGSYIVGVYEGLIEFSRGILAPKVATTELCVGDVCVTEDDFREVFGEPEPQVMGASSVETTDNSSSSEESNPTQEPSVETGATSTEPLATSTNDGLDTQEPATEEPVVVTEEETIVEPAEEPVEEVSETPPQEASTVPVEETSTSTESQ